MSSITSWPSASIPGVVIPANSPPSDDRQNSIGTDSILRDRPERSAGCKPARQPVRFAVRALSGAIAPEGQGRDHEVRLRPTGSSQGGSAVSDRSRPLCRRRQSLKSGLPSLSALTVCACPLARDRCDGGAEGARRARSLHQCRRDGVRARRPPLHGAAHKHRRHAVGQPALSAAGQRPRAPCRPDRRGRRRGDIVAGARCGGTDRLRLRAAAADRRHRRRAQSGRTAGVGRRAWEPLLSLAKRRPQGDRRGLRRCRPHHPDFGRQQSRRGQCHGAARLARHLRSGHAPLHALYRQPGRPHAPHGDRGHPGRARARPARADARRRRRLRHEGHGVCRSGAGAVAGAHGRPAGQVDLRALRGLPQRHAGPRQCD